MKYDCCDRPMSNTLYEIGEKKMCAICWLGKKEGSKPKYWKTDAAWTESKLKKHKDDLKKQRLKHFEKKRNA